MLLSSLGKILLALLFPLSNFPSTDTTLLLGCKSTLAFVVFGVESNLCKIPSAVVFLTLFNTSYELFSLTINILIKLLYTNVYNRPKPIDKKEYCLLLLLR